jgi:hypothetical protein
VRTIAQAKVATLNERIAELQALREEMMRLAECAAAFEAECVEGSSICLAVERAQPATP